MDSHDYNLVNQKEKGRREHVAESLILVITDQIL